MTTAKLRMKFSPRRGAERAEPAEPIPTTRIPRVAKMMALAVRFDHLIKTGQVKDQAELARLAHVSRARLTQIMDLLLLAPDIQEILVVGSYPETSFTERQLRSLASVANWSRQRNMWDSI